MTRENSTTKPKFIILEGCDRSGKDSMQDAIDKQTRYKHVVTDRGPLGFQAYCIIFNKPQELYLAYQKMELDLQELPNVLVIYLTADTEVLIDRCLQTDHELLDFNFHKEVYESFINTTNLETITVDTSKKHVNEIVQDLIKEGVL